MVTFSVTLNNPLTKISMAHLTVLNISKIVQERDIVTMEC